jgi:thiamine transport system substrate-binding protein
MVSQAVLNAGNPVADVMWGIDNTFLCRGLEAGIFTPYTSVHIDTVDPTLRLDPFDRVTPVDFSDLCVNYWVDALDGPAPASIADLAEPEYAATFVTQNPETSAPGMGFLLSTIATFGDGGWQDYWERLADNGLAVQPGWSEAYYGDFIAGGGDKAIVMSYASSPVAELLFADPPVDVPPTAALLDSCFRSIEFAGVLAGSDHPQAAAQLVDFLLSPVFQEDIPLNMFIFPANSEAALPAEFVEWAPLADDPLTLAPDEIEANRDDWTEQWTEIVLR